MPLFLRHRRTDLMELMDRDDVDLGRLFRTYDHFGTINPLLARWKHLYKTEIAPLMRKDPSRSYSILDIGCGGCDVLEYVLKLARKDGFKVSGSGIDPDERAAAYVRLRSPEGHLHFRNAYSSTLVDEGMKFDFVISNHVIHHLGDDQVRELLADAKALSRIKVVINDIERSDIAWLSFNLSWPFFLGSFITIDGLTSIRRSFRSDELKALAPEGWQVLKVFPYRLVLSYEHERALR
jgi:2-polyprenyl-3-methyl-5-hydroxy-6-metoxy-1,4-benzoquinol methylase